MPRTMTRIPSFIGSAFSAEAIEPSSLFRLQTHISILEQQQNSNGYFSYEETPSLHEQVRSLEQAEPLLFPSCQSHVTRQSNEDADVLEKLLQ